MKVVWEDVKPKKQDYVWVDVRTPGEYREGSIPGALNIPLISDEERVEIGTLYKQMGPDIAKETALSYIGPKLPQLMKDLKAAVGDRNAVLFCWRGGLRSRSVTHLASWMGIKVHQLDGGYKAYRHHVLQRLEKADWKARFIVLHGQTGVGKTMLLQRLAQEGLPVVDLESMAAHRGSIFGRIGLEGAHNQKVFDALLASRIDELENEAFVFIEAESRRIGKVFVPPFILDRKESGIHILIEATLDTQVERIVEEYTASQSVNPAQFQEAFSHISKRLHPSLGAEIEQALAANNLEAATRLLITHYYNPRYAHAREQYAQKVEHTVQSDNLEAAVAELKSIYLSLHGE